VTATTARRNPISRVLVWTLCLLAGLAVGGSAALVIGFDLAPAPVVNLLVLAIIGAPVFWLLGRPKSR
jgi:hypothetical protein